MASPEAARLLRIARRDLKMARRLLDPDLARLLLLLEQSSVDITDLLSLRAFSTFAVQCRYDDEPEELSLDRAAWCNRAAALIDQVQALLD
jgi:hypothetical protein